MSNKVIRFSPLMILLCVLGNAYAASSDQLDKWCQSNPDICERAIAMCEGADATDCKPFIEKFKSGKFLSQEEEIERRREGNNKDQ